MLMSAQHLPERECTSETQLIPLGKIRPAVSLRTVCHARVVKVCFFPEHIVVKAWKRKRKESLRMPLASAVAVMIMVSDLSVL